MLSKLSFDQTLIRHLENKFKDKHCHITVAVLTDYPEIAALSAKARKDEVRFPLSVRTIEWLVDQNPNGKGFVVIAKNDSDNAIVGHFVFYAKQMSFLTKTDQNPSTFLTYLCVNLYVAPNYRRNGLFKKMTAFGREFLQKSGDLNLYTVPNPRSAPGFVKMGMTRFGTVPFRFGLALKWAISSPPTRVELRKKFKEEFLGTFVNTPTTQPVISGKRNATLLNWRYKKRPDVNYNIWVDPRRDGYLVTRQLTIRKINILLLCDFWLEQFNATNLNALISAAIRQARVKNLTFIATMAGSPDVGFDRVLCKTGLILVPQFFLPQPVMVVGNLEFGRNCENKIVDLKNNWLITSYDWDVF